MNIQNKLRTGKHCRNLNGCGTKDMMGILAGCHKWIANGYKIITKYYFLVEKRQNYFNNTNKLLL